VVLLDGARETLVLLGIVVLEADLQVDGLHELALLGLLGVLQHLLNALEQGFFGHFTEIGKYLCKIAGSDLMTFFTYLLLTFKS